MKIKLWIDDVRVPPDETWIWAKNAYEAVGLILLHEISEVSFDHDLGKPYMNVQEVTGYDVAKVIEGLAHMNVMPRIKWGVHSANPVGRKNIELAMVSAERFWDCNEYKKNVTL